MSETLPQTELPQAIKSALSKADNAFALLDDALSQIDDGDLHRAHRDGGWTIAQVISHINMCSVMWLGDIKRLESDPDLDFFYREEIGHDLTGYPPPTVNVARKQLASTRRSLTKGIPNIDAATLERVVTIPDLGTKTVEDWTPLILGHAASHTDQAFKIMRDREFGPRGI